MTTQSISPTTQIGITEDIGKPKEAIMALQSSKQLIPPIITVILQPRDSPFQTKTLELRDKARIRIGRQTSSKTAPGPLNGYFDSKVLSRTHAELFSDKGKVYIKDVKSSNGTFLNGRRLSNENEESIPMEIKTNDQIEFGIDILHEDGSIMYHKVSCQVYIMPTSLSQMDPNLLKELNIGFANGTTNDHDLRRKSSSSSISSSSSTASTAVDFSTSPGSVVSHKKSSPRNWELLLAKLQGELQKSQEVESHLRSVKDAIEDVDKTLGKAHLERMDAQSAALLKKLEEAQAQVAVYAEKCRQQDRAVASALQELQRLRNTIRTLERENAEMSSRQPDHELRRQVEELNLALEEQRLQLSKDLMTERERCLEFENKCLTLEKRIKQLEKRQQQRSCYGGLADALQIRGVQISLAILLGVISALLYVLIAI